MNILPKEIVGNTYKILTTIAVVTAAIGGYAFFDSEQADPTHEVTLQNEDETAHMVSVSILNSKGDSVFDETRRVSPGEKWNVTTQAEPGNYTIRITTASGLDDETTYSLPLVDGGRKSFTTIYLRSQGKVSIKSYWQD